jgi:alpha-glucosidase
MATALFERLKLHGTPAANPQSIVQSGSARFTVLTARLIRLEWSPDAVFEDRATFAFPNRYADAPAFTDEQNGNQFTLETEALSLCYQVDRQPFSAANLSITLKETGRVWTPGQENLGNLRGTTRTLDQCAAAARLQEGIVSREGWALFDDSGSPVWDWDQTWVDGRPDSHLQDWYFFGYGRDYKAALREYIQFGGQVPLIPRYVLGAWWSRFWAYSADDLAALVDEFKTHDVPLDVLVIDMDWHSPDGWTGYTWNYDLFPEPEKFLAWVHAQGLQATLNLHPADGIQKHEEAYPRFAELLGRDPALGEGIQFASTDKAFIQHYFELLHHPLEDQGVDFWWLDWQQGEATAIKNLDPLAWLNHLHFRDSTRRGKRPMLYSRWGGLGNHRYPIGFSGDTYATWEALRFQPYFTATAANVAYGWWSHDIGGHFGATDPELYARWVQFGAVSPVLRLHSTKDPLAERRPWGFSAEVYAVAKAAMQLRYALLPYLYSSAHAATLEGLSLCTPMYYEYPESEDAYLARDQYFLGSEMFVAPITSPVDPETNLATFDVWIPDGVWIEYTTREQFTGPCWVRLQGDLNRIPMFVRAGAVIPTTPGLMRTRDVENFPLVLEVFPGTTGGFDLYEDDGTTEAYQHADYEITPILLSSKHGRIVLHLSGAQGRCEALPQKRMLEIHLKGVEHVQRVTVNGTEFDDWQVTNAGDLILPLGMVNRYAPLEIVVRAEPIAAPATVQTPFIHVIDYDAFADARQQRGTLILVNEANEPYDAEILWKLETSAGVTDFPMLLEGVTGRQIVHSPFADDGTFTTSRWRVSVNGAEIYTSRAAYPGVQRWQIYLYNREQSQLPPHAIMSANGTLPRQTATPNRAQLPNIHQAFGLVLLEKEQTRIKSGEPLEACTSAHLVSQTEQKAILCIHAIGTHTAYLNDEVLTPTDPIQHETIQPLFNSWMPAKPTYYTVTLHAGENELSIFSQPDVNAGWWGVGAVVFDQVGKVIPIGN